MSEAGRSLIVPMDHGISVGPTTGLRDIAATVGHALAAWPQDKLRLYIGCYRDDSATLAAAMTRCNAGMSAVRAIRRFRGSPPTSA